MQIANGPANLSLSDAERVLQDVAGEAALLHFIVALPRTGEMLIGFNRAGATPGAADGGRREHQVLLDWAQLTTPYAP